MKKSARVAFVVFVCLGTLGPSAYLGVYQAESLRRRDAALRELHDKGFPITHKGMVDAAPQEAYDALEEFKVIAAWWNDRSTGPSVMAQVNGLQSPMDRPYTPPDQDQAWIVRKLEPELKRTFALEKFNSMVWVDDTYKPHPIYWLWGWTNAMAISAELDHREGRSESAQRKVRLLRHAAKLLLETGVDWANSLASGLLQQFQWTAFTLTVRSNALAEKQAWQHLLHEPLPQRNWSRWISAKTLDAQAYRLGSPTPLQEKLEPLIRPRMEMHQLETVVAAARNVKAGQEPPTHPSFPKDMLLHALLKEASNLNWYIPNTSFDSWNQCIAAADLDVERAGDRKPKFRVMLRCKPNLQR